LHGNLRSDQTLALFEAIESVVGSGQEGVDVTDTRVVLVEAAAQARAIARATDGNGADAGQATEDVVRGTAVGLRDVALEAGRTGVTAETPAAGLVVVIGVDSIKHGETAAAENGVVEFDSVLHHGHERSRRGFLFIAAVTAEKSQR
jgi:hypothetical protein